MKKLFPLAIIFVCFSLLFAGCNKCRHNKNNCNSSTRQVKLLSILTCGRNLKKNMAIHLVKLVMTLKFQGSEHEWFGNDRCTRKYGTANDELLCRPGKILQHYDLHSWWCWWLKIFIQPTWPSSLKYRDFRNSIYRNNSQRLPTNLGKALR